MSERLDKLNKLANNKKSSWLEDIVEIEKNKEWLKHSQRIALKVLRTLREKGMSQKTLAESISVSPQQISKIVKGKENLTLETISKLEKALDINLIFETKISTPKIILKNTSVYDKTLRGKSCFLENRVIGVNNVESYRKRLRC